jgi:precorrin-6B methylase 2
MYRPKYLTSILLLLSPVVFGCSGSPSHQQQSTSADTLVYGRVRASPDGIGKTYFGREIAQVMGFAGAAWLERDEREEEENAQVAIGLLPLNASSVVADIGAGTGYYTFRIARLVPQGKVLAVEVQDESVRYLQERVKAGGVQNVEVVKGRESTPQLLPLSVDVALMVDVYHELEYPQEMLRAIHAALRPGGKLVLLEYRAEDPTVPIKRLHKLSVRQAKKELEANGFQMVRQDDRLPIQHFLVFEKVE